MIENILLVDDQTKEDVMPFVHKDIPDQYNIEI